MGYHYSFVRQKLPFIKDVPNHICHKVGAFIDITLEKLVSSEVNDRASINLNGRKKHIIKQ